MTTFDAALAEWRTIVAAEDILVGDAAQAAYGSDTGGFRRAIPAAIRIRDAGVLPAVLRSAQKFGVPIYPISTGRNWGYGDALPARDGCAIVDLSPLDRILHFDAGLGVVTVEPGVTQKALADFLDSGGHDFLVPVTGAGPGSSLVGNALERGYGITPHADHFAAVTDVEAVLPDGSLYRTALKEIGGPDLARLYRWGIGPYTTGLFSQGGYGVVTQMTIQLARRPERCEVCLFGLREDALLGPAVDAVRAVLTRLPGIVGGINLMNRHRVLAMTVPYPRASVGTDGLVPPEVIERLGREQQTMAWTGFAALYGTRLVVAAARREIRRALSGIASRMLFVSPQRAALLDRVAGWLPGALSGRARSVTRTLRQALELVGGRPNETALPLAYWRHLNPPATAGDYNPSRDGCGLIWYAPLVPMRRQQVSACIEMIHRVTARHGIEPLITLTSQGDKLFDSTVPLLFERDRPAAVAAAQTCYRELFEAGRGLGCVPYRIGSSFFDLTSRFQRHSAAFDARLRASVDPKHVVAPGRYA